MAILIAEDNLAQRRYLRDVLEREFARHGPVVEAENGERAVELALAGRPELLVLDIQMPGLSGVKVARAVWREFPSARIVFWTQFPHAIYINEIRKLVKAVSPQPAYGFIHKNNVEERLAYNQRTRAFFEALRRGLINAEELEHAARELSGWLEADRRRHDAESSAEDRS